MSLGGSLVFRSLAWVPLAAALASIPVRSGAATDSLARLGEALPLVEAFSGHIAILPGLPGENLRSTCMGKALREAGLEADLVWLTPEQMVDTNYFCARRFVLAVYLGGEAFFQTIRNENDAEAALRKYLAGGGTLLALPYGAFPFYYNQAGKPVGVVQGYGLNIGVNGFDRRPDGRTLTFHANTNQTLFRFPAPSFPFPEEREADQRWRAIGDPQNDLARYTPLLTLRDDRGQSHADGAAVVEHLKGPLAGARAVYVWCSLLENTVVRETVLGDGLRYALAGRPPPPASLAARRSPLVSGDVGEGFWRGVPTSRGFWDLGKSLSQASPATAWQARWDARRLYLALRCERTRAQESAGEDSLRLQFGTNLEDRAALVLDSQKGLRNMMTNAAGITCVLGQGADFWRAELAIPWKWFQSVSAQPVLDTRCPLQITRMVRNGAGTAPQIQVWSPPVASGNASQRGFLRLVADPCSDDFDDRGQADSGSAGWRLAGGKWRIEDGSLVGEDCISSTYEIQGAARGDQSWRDYSLRVRFRVDSRGSDWRDGPWFGVRTRPDGDGYYLNFSDRDCQLQKVLYGLSTSDANPLARASWRADSAWHALHVEMRANRIRVQVDDRVLFEVKDDAHMYLPSLRSGGITLAARKAPASQGRTVVRFRELRIEMPGPESESLKPGDKP